MAKRAMVKPPPVSPDLFDLVRQVGKGRNYVLIEKHKHSWLVMFEGDHEPTLIKVEPALEEGDPD